MGLFVTVEGGEFTGKTSLVVPTLAAVLKRSGFQTLKSREPGGTPRGEQIRGQIFNRFREGAQPEELIELFNQQRGILIKEVIRPFLGEQKEKPAVLILDRFIDSTIVYQGLEGNLPLDKLRDLERQTIEGYYPDITLLLYFPEEKFRNVFSARRRLASSEEGRSQTVWDEGSIEYHLERQRNYFKVPKIYEEWNIQRNFAFIDASQRPRHVIADALLAINPLLQRVEGEDVRTEKERIYKLFSVFNKYSSEGHLFGIEQQWQKQEALIRGEGNRDFQRRK